MHSSSSGGDEDAPIAAINIIPLVDVVLVLLIIFMVTTVFTKNSALKLDLPQGSRAQEPQQPPAQITVSVDKSQHITVNNEPTRLENIDARIQSLSNKSGKTIVVLCGDKTVLYGTIMPVLDEISRTGVEMTLALQAPKANASGDSAATSAGASAPAQ